MNQSIKTKIENLIESREFLKIANPIRYMGGEFGAVDKSGDPNITLRAVVCFPDLYEIGMSNAAVKIMYEKLNGSSRNANAYDTFTKQCANALDFPVISNVGTYLFKERYMSNSEWHCTYEGADIRTEELTYDLKKFLNSSGLSDTYETYNTRKSHNSSAYQNGM